MDTLSQGCLANSSSLLREIVTLFEKGKVKPVAHHRVIDVTDLEGSLRQTGLGPSPGKTLIQMPRDPTNLPASITPSPLRFRDDAAYLLVGGLGGLGVALSTYMVEHGARHFVYFSRSASSDFHSSFFRELEAQGCTVQALAGDISSTESVRSALSQVTQPIAGALHLGMVLRDRPFLSMTHDDWLAAIKPKVDGTWNLHNILVELDVHLDFFVLFGSISGSFGMPHQANYSAGNAFQDAFVQYRHGLGLPASVIDVGVMADVGYVSETPSAQEFFRSGGTSFMKVEELFQALHLSILRQRRHRCPTAHRESAPPKSRNPNDAATAEATTNKAGRGWELYVSDPGWASPSQLTLGVRGDKPMTDPTNRVLWKRDRRVGIMRNIEAARTSLNDGGAASVVASGTGGRGDRIGPLMAALRASSSPGALLEEPDTLRTLTLEIGRFIYECMFKPVGEEGEGEGEEIELQRSLMTLGVDSLVTIEVRNWLRRRLGIEVSTLEMLNGGTIENLGVLVKDRIQGKFVTNGSGGGSGTPA